MEHETEDSEKDMSYLPYIEQLSYAPYASDMDRRSRTCMLNTEDEICMNDAICSNDSMSSKKQVSSFQDEDYTENMKQFQLQVDKFKKLAKPGCSPEILNTALGSMLSLFDTLSLITSKRYIRASL
ncbi:uncharacterized protein LOC142519246 [Primulina tabacum]|uniref:uncharacterized protein LOC142519246 n=1 Tax=Primulina tabacum TaxID=48773 RepID=UPI003F5972D2